MILIIQFKLGIAKCVKPDGFFSFSIRT